MAINIEAKTKDLIKKRGSIKAKLTQFSSYFSLLKKAKVDDVLLLELDMRIDKLEALYNYYDELQVELELLADSPEEQYAEREHFETSYYSVMAAARELSNKNKEKAKSKSEVGSSDAHSTAIPKNHAHVRLPVINLPHFGGGYKNWLEFKDLFVSLIHEDKNLDNITKFHYLRTSLHGSAAIILQSLDLRADNYITAWKLLCERYDNKQLLVSNHVQALFNAECINKESSQALRQIVDITNKNLRSLATLGQPVQHWDTLIIHIMSSKLDSMTSRHWEEYRNSLNEAPTLDMFIKFIHNRSNLLESLEESRITKGKPDLVHNKTKTFVVTSKTDFNKINCPMCNKQHYLFSCETFRALPVDSRLPKVKEYNLCTNCLRPGHTEAKCKLGHCKYCKTKHNTLLHKHIEPNIPLENVTLSANHDNTNSSPHILLSTALVKVVDSKGNPHRARILLDNGSTANFISQELYSKLNLPTRIMKSKIVGINNQVSNSTQSCSLHIESYSGDYSTNIDCFIMPTITSQIPHTYIDIQHMPLPSGIHLADPSFNIPSSIDILVGADVFWSVIGSNRIDLGKHNPTLYETKLGWLISGVVHQASNSKSVCLFTQNSDNIQSDILMRFWELDSISPKHNLTQEERLCEDTFIKTTRRTDDGRFVVTIPFKECPDVLGNSFEMARCRFFSLERKMNKDPNFKARYVEFMNEYEALGHMTETKQNMSSQKTCFLPHHGVTKESSTTTKLRVVFDASARTSSGKSLNDIQAVGPTIQDDLLSILLRFRQHRIVVSADIEKMYRFVDVEPAQRPLQQILWRPDPSLPLKRYMLNTVTYGTASAPFLSTRCLLQLAQESSAKVDTHKPSADLETLRALAHDFYVDDYLGGTDSTASAIALCSNLSNILKSAQFNLRKWQSNSLEVLKAVTNFESTSMSVDLSAKEQSKTLGISWQCNTDTLTFTISQFLLCVTKINKRHILSTISQVFDPLGLVSPCIVEAKILMQRLWVDNCSWDDEVPDEIKKAWINFAHTLLSLNNISIPRGVVCSSPMSVQIHVFTDASEKAYGACVYVRTVASDETVSVRLLASKSKVSPIKPMTIPRLELCAALLGTRLCTKVCNSFTLKADECTFWCDSTIVLGWLSSSPAHLKPFVRNRVCEIQESSAGHVWRHVPSKENPADLVSRGLSANFISDTAFWWSGPTFLAQDSSSWPVMSNTDVLDLPETIKSLHATSTDVTDNSISNLIQNSSSFNKLQRVMAYMTRFIHNCRNSHNKITGSITLSELNYACNYLIRIAQQESFPIEYDLLKSGKNLPHKSRLKSLSPFYENDIIRVGGRLDNSFYDYNTKHPILICSKHKLSKLIFSTYHMRLFHAGPQLLLATIRHQYWPLGGRNLAKQTVRTCIRCIRFKGATIQPIMGNLPKERLQLEFPFLETGIDYAGPILIADRKGRGCRLIKSYMCVFICLASRAVHLELVSDLTKEAFIAALNRFTARRGKPATIYSDNGTTFVGSFNELSRVLQNSAHELHSLHSGINFSFIPAYTPHFGGLWEAAVKSVKHHLKRTLGLTHLTYEEMSTTIIQIEAILNSRPLTPLSDDPSDLTSLSPAHFLIGRSALLPPSPDIATRGISSLQRFQRVEHLKQHFWRRFHDEYITQLQRKTKWLQSTGELEKGALVLVKEKNLPPLLWLLGRVVRLLPGRDGVSRVADILTRKGIIRRAFPMICPLPINH